jgi:formate hydrogenlyase subunit 3/multisubunit Na+/H+ antiporter MnhD subunit
MEAVLTGILVWILGGLAALILSRFPRLASTVGASAAVVGALIALTPTLRVLLDGGRESQVLPWDAVHGRFHVELDPLGAAFLLPILALSVISAVYGAKYLMAHRHKKSLGAPWFFFNTFIAGMTLVVIARTVLLFVFAWEVMSLTAFFLITFEHEDAGVRRAGWVYLVAAQLGVAFLLAAFMILGNHARSLEFAAFASATTLSATTAGAVFVLTLIGFGAKAGVVPFHVWLPEAHPAAPSHVSALMSGVMIKMGLYGLLRVLTFLGQPAPWWGITLAVTGMITALVGISVALYQRDIKRILAYSSIENMGLITLSLGVGFWGQATNRPIVATFGMAGALLHIWNHSLMKSLLFLAAGSILHATGTRDVEQLGGLMKRMPWTATIMTLGSVAIAALPPLNGFTGKWLIYLGLLHSGLSTAGDHGLTALLAAGLLALVGGLAAVTFVRLTGIALLGSPRGETADHAHESSPWMVAPMVLLAASCLAMALMPFFALDCVAQVLRQLQGSHHALTGNAYQQTRELLLSVGIFSAWLLGVIGIMSALLAALARASSSVEAATWGCGYLHPTQRMQYTGQSFAEMSTQRILPGFLRPRHTRKPPEGLFPAPGDFASHRPDPLCERVYEPLFARWARRCAQLRILQQGQVNIYLTYVVLAVVLALAWTSLRTWWRLAG